MYTPPTLTTFDTIYPADSVEFCPHPRYRNYFVCGTYKLEEEKTKDSGPQGDDGNDSTVEITPTQQKRVGQCWLMHSDDAGKFKPVQTLELPAVLDLKWSHSRMDLPRLAIADAVGCLSFYNLEIEDVDEETSASALVERQVLQCTSTSNICLSLDWSDRLRPESNGGKVVTSISDGSLAVIEGVDGLYAVTKSWNAHEYEPWIAAWNYWEEDIVYSGGDDLTWKGWDLRTDLRSPIFANKRSFEGGVTTIQAHPHRQHYVAVGSYDENVRIFDTRKPLTPISTTHVGGGVWRVKWHPSAQRKNDLIVACMHDGFKVVRLYPDSQVETTSLEGCKSEVVTSFNEHESLAYGVDWMASDAGDSQTPTLVASCSFYDHSLTTWLA